MPVKGAGSASGPQRRLPVERARRPKKKREPVSSAFGGPLQKADFSQPQRKAQRKVERARARVPNPPTQTASVGDRPQTREEDAQRADAYKKTAAYRRSRNDAVAARRRQNLARALEALAQVKTLDEPPSGVERIASQVAGGAVDRAKTIAREGSKAALLVNPVTSVTAVEALVASRAGVDVDKELSGEGSAAKALTRLGDFYRRGAIPSTGAGPSIGQRVAGGGRLPRGTAAISPHAVAIADLPPAFGNFGADVAMAPSAIVSSVYVPAKAAAQAAGGDTRGLREYGRGIQQSDPLYAVGEAIVRGATGDTKGAGESISRAGRLANEHPGFAAAELYGVVKSLSRGTSRAISGSGRVARATGRATGSEALQAAGKRAYDYATPTNRPDAGIPGTAFKQSRRYSRGIVEKRIQVRRDAAKSRKAQALRDEAKADTERAAALRDHAETMGPEAPDRVRVIREADRLDAGAAGKVASAARIDPEIASSRKMGAVRRRVDVQREAANEGRMALVAETERDLTKILRGRRTVTHPKGEEPPALNPIAQAIVKADVEDLRAYRTELEDAYRSLSEDGDLRATNVKVREELTRAIDAEEKRPGTLKDSAERARAFSETVDRPLDEQLIELGIITRGRAEKSKVIPFAGRKGAVVDETPRPTIAGERRMQAKADRRQAAVDLGQAQRRLGEAQRRYVAQTANVRVAKAAGKDPTAAIRKAEEAKVVRDAARDAVRGQQARMTQSRMAVHEVNRETKGQPSKAPPGLVDPRGRKLSTEKLIEDISRERDAPASFVGQKPNVTGGGSFYRDPSREPSIPGRPRTEKATVGGLYDPSVEAMRASALSRANMVGAAKGFRDGIFEFAQRDKNGDVVPIRGADAARKAAEKATRETGIPHTAINALPWEANHAEMMLSEAGMEPALAFDAMKGAMLDGLDGKGRGEFVVVPKAFADRTRQHVELLGPGDGEKMAQAFRGAFSRTVLSTSLSPLVGNAVEAAFRTAVMHAGPLSYLTWRKVIKTLREVDPEAAARFEHAVVGRGRVTYEASSRYMNADQFDPTRSPNLRAMVKAAEKLRNTKGIAVFPAAWRMWTHFVFEFLNNRMIERPTQRLQAGKAIRDSGLLGGDRIISLGEESIMQAAKGLTETKQQVAFANALRDSFGAYRALPPWQKRWISTYTPFVAWWLNSARFLGLVLPRDHPVLFALTAQALQVVDDVDRQKSRPGWLRGTMVGGGIQWQASRNTPFGAFTDPEKTLAGLFLPQAMPGIAAFAYGIDWKGKPLRNPDGSEYTTAQKVWYVAKQIGASSVPAYAVPDRAKKYYEDPGVLLNAIRVRTPSDVTGAAEPKVKGTPSKSAPKRAPSDDIWGTLNQGATTQSGYEDLWEQVDRAAQSQTGYEDLWSRVQP